MPFTNRLLSTFNLNMVFACMQPKTWNIYEHLHIYINFNIQNTHPFHAPFHLLFRQLHCFFLLSAAAAVACIPLWAVLL